MSLPKIPKAGISLAVVGFSSVVTQLVLIREGISTFGGNELVIGLILGLWLLSSASGAFLGALMARGKNPYRLLFSGHLLLAVIPFLQLVGFRALPLLWVRGELLGAGTAMIGSGLILTPYGLVAGSLIPLAAGLLSSNDPPSAAYLTDLGGEVLGGLVFSFLFVYLFSHWGVLMAVGFLNLGVTMLFCFPRRLWLVPALAALAIAVSLPLNFSTLSWQVPGQKILVHRNTPFAQLSITRSGQQVNVLSDGLPLFSSNDYRTEALAHIPLAQVGEGARVLLIGGGVFGTIAEILKHNPGRIDYVELDPAILRMDRHIHRSLDNPRVHTHVGDGRLFIKKARRAAIRYDCLVLDLPGPENIQYNRFYTREFFQEARSILTPRGVVFFTLTGADNYLEAEGLALNRSVYAALDQVFAHILLFPGETHYFLASACPLAPALSPGASGASGAPDIRGRLAERNIRTRWLVDYQLPEMTDPFRMDRLKGLVTGGDSQPNTDLSPRAFRHLLNLWLKKTGGTERMSWLIPAIAVLLALCLLVAWQRDKLLLVTFSSGYTGISLELSLLFLFQTIFGYVYLWISLFITLFMIGLGAGALAARKWRKDPVGQTLVQDSILILLVSLICGLAVFGRSLQADVLLSVVQCGIIPVLIFGSALAVGWQFVAVSHQLIGKVPRITGKLYLADLAGASCGTLVTSLFLLPGFGILGVLLSAALVKSASLAALVKMRKSR
ncbi:MAG: hypothetical protein AB1611_15125 [bacterium]